MNADLKGALQQIDRSYKAFEHKGKKMTKAQVKKVLEYGIRKGYETTADLSDNEIDNLLQAECTHDWKEEYYGNRCSFCDLFYPYGLAPWEYDDYN